MKIEAEPPRPAPERPAPQGSEPVRPFTDFLAEPETRAARFTELGMFGVSRAVAAPAPAKGGTGAPALPETAPAPSAGGTMPIAVSETPAPEAPLDAGDPATCALPRPALAKAEPGKGCALPGEAPGRVQERDVRPGPEPTARTTRARPRPAAPRPAVSLSLRETDGGIEIVAGAPPIDPETRAQLRRLIEAILAAAAWRSRNFS